MASTPSSSIKVMDQLDHSYSYVLERKDSNGRAVERCEILGDRFRRINGRLIVWQGGQAVFDKDGSYWDIHPFPITKEGGGTVGSARRRLPVADLPQRYLAINPLTRREQTVCFACIEDADRVQGPMRSDESKKWRSRHCQRCACELAPIDGKQVRG